MHTLERIDARRRRLAAASIVAVVSVTIAAAVHSLAGGGTPPPVTLLLALVASGIIGMAVAGRRLTRRRALTGVVLDQLSFHAVFAFFGPAPASSGARLAASGAHASHDGIANGVLGVATAGAEAGTASTVSMLVAHIVAAAIAYAILRRGMTAVDAIAGSLASALARLLPAAPAAVRMTTPQRSTITGIATFSAGSALVRLPDRRGPPMLFAR